MEVVIVAATVVVVLVVVLVLVLRSALILVPPNQLAVISGRSHRLPDGRTVGYKVVSGGRAVVVPILEQVDWMDLSNIPLELEVRKAYAKDGTVNLSGAAQVRITRNPSTQPNAIERFLSMSREQIGTIASQTLEGVLREVAARLTLTKLTDDEEWLMNVLMEEAEHDFAKLGLDLDTVRLRVEVVERRPPADADAQAPPPEPAAPLAPAPGQPDAAADPLDGDSPPWAREK